MSQSPAGHLKQTPLNARHRALGARMMACAGWDMPVEYAGLTREHLAVRTRAGLFDLTHMGQVEMAGVDALAAVQWVSCNDASRLEQGQAQYSALTTPEGTFVDDLRVYRLGDRHFLLVVNAANVAADVAWIGGQVRHLNVAVLDTSARYALVALQGPLAGKVLQPLANFDLSTLKSDWCAHGEVAAVRATICRSEYTGEDGFEILVPPAQAAAVWDAILAEGQDDGVMPAGLGARDTLRLEAARRLYGHDIDRETTVLEAGLEGIIAWQKGDFLGRAALERQQSGGLTRTLAGFEMVDHAIARHGHRALVDGAQVGHVTSGTRTPFLKRAMGMAYLPVDRTTPGAQFDVEIRGRMRRARVVPLPFYNRPRG